MGSCPISTELCGRGDALTRQPAPANLCWARSTPPGGGRSGNLV